MADVYKSVTLAAAKIAAQSPVMDSVAEQVKARLESTAAPHSKSGDYASSFNVGDVYTKRGVRDREVYSDDPLAQSKEFGHFIKEEGSKRILGYAPGLHIFSKVIRSWRG